MGCKAECLLGWCKSGCLSCTAPAQVAVASCTGLPAAPVEPCLESTVQGACTADDAAALADTHNTGEKQSKCGRKALGFSGINHDKFTSCVQEELGLTSGCSECYYATADYGFKNCKAECLLGWCKSGCQSCTAPAQEAVASCTGLPAAPVEPCLESTVQGACTADDAAALADTQNTGEKQSKCGRKALGFSGI